MFSNPFRQSYTREAATIFVGPYLMTSSRLVIVGNDPLTQD